MKGQIYLTPVILEIGRVKPEDYHELGDILSYLPSSRPAWLTEQDPTEIKGN